MPAETPIPVRLQNVRMAIGENQRDLAKRFCVSPSCICLWEQGKRELHGPSLLVLEALEKMYADQLKELEERRPAAKRAPPAKPA